MSSANGAPPPSRAQPDLREEVDVIEAGDRIPAVRASTCDGGVFDLGSFAGKGVLFIYREASTGG
jgi:hypothetical protein